MRIPKQLQLFGETITTEYDKHLVDKTDHRGEVRYRESKIVLQPITDGTFQRTTTSIEQTYCHELTHWILFMMSNKLDEDENFVEVFSRLLHQALTTMEYEE